MLTAGSNLQKMSYLIKIGSAVGKKKADNKVSGLGVAKSDGNNPDLNFERKLVARVQGGDFAALEELYHLYNRAAFGLAVKILRNSEAAEDAVHDAFLRFWKQPDNFDAKRGKFVTWLLSVVHNLCIDQLRRKYQSDVSLDQSQTQDYVTQIADQSLDVEEEVWLTMQRKIVRQAVDSLSSEQRYVVELAFFKGLTHQEIADQTGQPLGTVKSRIRQGLKKLKELIQPLEVKE